jgi:hypothetical protein
MSGVKVDFDYPLPLRFRKTYKKPNREEKL